MAADLLLAQIQGGKVFLKDSASSCSNSSVASSSVVRA
jgi:hypothetical protein